MSHRGLAAMALGLGVVASACLFRAGRDPTRFYVLTPTIPTAGAAPGAFTIGIGPVVMPGYLQRPMLATRVNPTEVRYAEFDRWAEPLPALFTRVLGQDLAAILDAARVVPYPWYPATPVDAVVRVEVNAFEADVHGNVRLDACWTVREGRASAPRRSECSTIAETVGDSGADARVAGLSRAVGALAQRIASAVRP